MEVMMRSIRQTTQTMLLELKRPPSDVKSILPVIQHAFNHTPSQRNGDLAPITAMTQLPPSNAMNAFLAVDHIQEIEQAKLKNWSNLDRASQRTRRSSSCSGWGGCFQT